MAYHVEVGGPAHLYASAIPAGATAVDVIRTDRERWRVDPFSNGGLCTDERRRSASARPQGGRPRNVGRLRPL